MKKSIWIFILLLLSSTVFAQGIARNWFGTLTIPGGKPLHLVFHIVKSGDIYNSTIDDPDQGAKGLQTDMTTVNGNQLTINIAKYGVQYTGVYLPDSNLIKGTFKQGAAQFSLTLSATKADVRVAPPVIRPQDPKDFPYKQDEIVFTNTKAGNQLAGTITMPADGKAKKIVILITGSGPETRNEEVFNHRPFLVWSDWLTRHGIAVLRYDDRGTGQSTGSFRNSTTADFADDAGAAVNYIQSRADLKKLSVGLMGHSEGGMIAPMVASRNPAVKFIVLLAGPGVPIVQLMIKQSADELRVDGAPEEAIRLSTATNQKLYTLVAQSAGLPAASLKKQVDTLLYRELRAYPAADLGGRNIADIVSSSDAELLDPWFRYFIAFDPGKYLEKVSCPVLALNGTKDMQVNAEANLAGIRSSLKKGNDRHFEIVPLGGLNHLFQKANTGSEAEYSQIQETVNPAALEKVSAWINQL